jgi:hypothetical protein
LFLTSRSEIRPLKVRVIDGIGKPVSGITVNAESSDAMTRKTKKQAATGSDGVAHFKFWSFRYIEVSATAPGCVMTRATYGVNLGRKGWKLSSGCPQYDPTTVDLHLRGVNDFVLPDVRKRVAEFLLSVKGDDAEYALARLGTSFENFEIMDQIMGNAALSGSVDTFLSNQAGVVVNLVSQR